MSPHSSGLKLLLVLLSSPTGRRTSPRSRTFAESLSRAAFLPWVGACLQAIHADSIPTHRLQAGSYLSKEFHATPSLSFNCCNSRPSNELEDPPRGDTDRPASSVVRAALHDAAAFITIIKSARRSVLSRCATIKVVRPADGAVERFESRAPSRCRSPPSDRRAGRIAGSSNTARAMARRWR